MSSVVAPLLHKYVYAPVPPLTVKFMAPVLLPLHATPVTAAAATCIAEGCEIVALMLVELPLESVIVSVYVPAGMLAIRYEPPEFAISFPAGFPLTGPDHDTL